MKKAISVSAVAVVFFAVGAFAAEKAKNYVITSASDIKWTDMPNVAEVKTATLEGDATKGAHHAITKFAAGFTSPVHHHTADHYGVLISGALTVIVDGVESKLGPGSYFQFTKKQLHQARCEVGAECIFFTDVRGKGDMVPAKEQRTEAAPAKK